MMCPNCGYDGDVWKREVTYPASEANCICPKCDCRFSMITQLKKITSFKELTEKITRERGIHTGSTLRRMYDDFKTTLADLNPKDKKEDPAIYYIFKCAADRAYGELYGYIIGISALNYLSFDEMKALADEIKHMREEALE